MGKGSAVWEVAQSHWSQLDGTFPEKLGEGLCWHVCIGGNGDVPSTDAYSGMWWRIEVAERNGSRWWCSSKVLLQEEDEADKKKTQRKATGAEGIWSCA